MSERLEFNKNEEDEAPSTTMRAGRALFYSGHGLGRGRRPRGKPLGGNEQMPPAVQVLARWTPA